MGNQHAREAVGPVLPRDEGVACLDERRAKDRSVRETHSVKVQAETEVLEKARVPCVSIPNVARRWWPAEEILMFMLALSQPARRSRVVASGKTSNGPSVARQAAMSGPPRPGLAGLQGAVSTL